MRPPNHRDRAELGALKLALQELEIRRKFKREKEESAREYMVPSL